MIYSMNIGMHQKASKKTVQWVKSHQDDDTPWTTNSDLIDLKLSPEATLNVWCDRQANEAHTGHQSFPDAEVLPAEKWALFASTPHTYKITGKLDQELLMTYHYNGTQTYITRKHGLSAEKMQHVQTEHLRRYLDNQKIHCRANTIKLLHRWIPTKDMLHKQNREESPICERCMSKNEDADHILTCQDATAQKERSDILYDALHKLCESDMPTNIAVELECHLCQTLHIPSLQYYKSNEETDRTQVRTAVTHQNIIGWENALRGYVSSYWISKEFIKGKNKRQLHKRYWDNMMVGSLIDIHHSIWNKRNEHMHGKTTQEARTKAREAVIHRVANIYKVKPKLASRYHPIDSI